jgi:hypothetical protein
MSNNLMLCSNFIAGNYVTKQEAITKMWYCDILIIENKWNMMNGTTHNILIKMHISDHVSGYTIFIIHVHIYIVWRGALTQR